MSGSIRAIVAKNIRALRTAKAMSQEVLARNSGLTLRFISRLENDPQNLTLDSLEAIAKALGVTVIELLQDRSKGLPKPSKKAQEAIDQVISALQAYRTFL